MGGNLINGLNTRHLALTGEDSLLNFWQKLINDRAINQPADF